MAFCEEIENSVEEIENSVEKKEYCFRLSRLSNEQNLAESLLIGNPRALLRKRTV
jgi:hypothetical protein